MNKYTEMQKNQYELDAGNWSIENRNPVVGSFDQHNQWGDYDKYLFKDIKDCKDKVALDFGCGPGRNLVKYKDHFKELHGIDIAERNIINAKKYLEFSGCDLNKHKLYTNSGTNLENINNEVYDIIMSTICMQHICVHDIRFSLFKEFYRILKFGGCITIQMGFGPEVNSKRSVGYYQNFYDAEATNGMYDTRVESPDQLKEDLEKIGFSDFNFYITQVGPGDGHPNWIFFNARKA